MSTVRLDRSAEPGAPGTAEGQAPTVAGSRRQPFGYGWYYYYYAEPDSGLLRVRGAT